MAFYLRSVNINSTTNLFEERTTLYVWKKGIAYCDPYGLARTSQWTWLPIETDLFEPVIARETTKMELETSDIAIRQRSAPSQFYRRAGYLNVEMGSATESAVFSVPGGYLGQIILGQFRRNVKLFIWYCHAKTYDSWRPTASHEIFIFPFIKNAR